MRACLSLPAAFLLALGCAVNGAEPVAAPEPASPAAPPPQVYVLFGTPMGWLRPGGDEGRFRADTRVCLDRSAGVRDASSPELRKQAAYDDFVDCMVEQGWSSTLRLRGAIWIRHAAEAPL